MVFTSLCCNRIGGPKRSYSPLQTETSFKRGARNCCCPRQHAFTKQPGARRLDEYALGKFALAAFKILGGMDDQQTARVAVSEIPHKRTQNLGFILLYMIVSLSAEYVALTPDRSLWAECEGAS